MATQMQVKVLFGRKLHGRPDFGVIFYVYTNVDNKERATASYCYKTKETNFVGRKTRKFKAVVRKWEMLAASKVKMSGSEK